MKLCNKSNLYLKKYWGMMGMEKKTKQLIQVLLGSGNVTGDVTIVLDQLHKQGIISTDEVRKFRNKQQTKKGIASC